MIPRHIPREERIAVKDVKDLDFNLLALVEDLTRYKHMLVITKKSPGIQVDYIAVDSLPV